jgi:hypothetical protein
MKITVAQLKELRSYILPALNKIPSAAQYAARDSSIPRIDRAQDTAKRHRWDALLASRFPVSTLYDAGLNDEHIDTALKHIIRTTHP